MKNKSLEQFKAEQAKALEKFELENKWREWLPEQFRENALIHLTDINGGFAGIRFWNNFRTEKTLADALPIIERYRGQIVQGEHWKSGCCSTWPAQINSCIKDKSAVMDGSHEIEISVEGGKGYGPYVEIQFWIKTELGLCEISLPVCDLHKLIPNVKASYNRHGEICDCTITWPGERSVVDKFRSWYAEKPGFNGSYYFADTHNFMAWASNQKPNPALDALTIA